MALTPTWGMVVDSGGVELFWMPRAAGNVWPTWVSGRLGDTFTNRNARAGGAAHSVVTSRIVTNGVRTRRREPERAGTPACRRLSPKTRLAKLTRPPQS